MSILLTPPVTRDPKAVIQAPIKKREPHCPGESHVPGRKRTRAIAKAEGLKKWRLFF